MSGEKELGEGMCLENTVRTCLMSGIGKRSSEPLKRLTGSLPGTGLGG